MTATEVKKPKVPPETIQAGLHILAKIIAREVANDRRAELEALESGQPFKGIMREKAKKNMQGIAQL